MLERMSVHPRRLMKTTDEITHDHGNRNDEKGDPAEL